MNVPFTTAAAAPISCRAANSVAKRASKVSWPTDIERNLSRPLCRGKQQRPLQQAADRSLRRRLDDVKKGVCCGLSSGLPNRLCSQKLRSEDPLLVFELGPQSRLVDLTI